MAGEKYLKKGRNKKEHKKSQIKSTNNMVEINPNMWAI